MSIIKRVLIVNVEIIGYVCDLSKPCKFYAFHIIESYDYDS